VAVGSDDLRDENVLLGVMICMMIILSWAMIYDDNSILGDDL
jgi:hypothetical protein